MATEIVLDMSCPAQKRLLLEQIRGLSGMHRITLTAYRPRRSDRQNRYYWPCFVQPFADYLRAQGDAYTDEQAHEIFKSRFLPTTTIDKNTGELLERVRSTTELDTVEFNEYLDRVGVWLAGFGIIVPEPTLYREAA